MSHMFTHTGAQEKSFTNAEVWYVWKICFQNHCPEDAQILLQWGEASLKRNIASLRIACYSEK